jgi:2-dehydropantoate 2-reductase
VGRWADQIKALAAGPLRVVYPDATEEQVTLRATGYELLGSDYDVALILTKAAGTKAAAECAAGVLAPDGIALTLQNGVGNLEIIAQEVGTDRAALGVTTQGGAMAGPGVLHVGGTGVTILATRPPIEKQIHALADCLNAAGLVTEIVEDISALVWGKLAINAAINPLTALLRIPNGALLDSEQTRSLMADAAKEVAAVAAAQGIKLPFDAAARAEEVARLTAPNRSSMLQDALRGARTEIETISGEVMRQGQKLGVPTPANAMLYHLIRAMEDLRQDSD